jgi:hypothetical protein
MKGPRLLGRQSAEPRIRRTEFVQTLTRAYGQKSPPFFDERATADSYANPRNSRDRPEDSVVDRLFSRAGYLRTSRLEPPLRRSAGIHHSRYELPCGGQERLL